MSCLLILFMLTLWGKSCVAPGQYCVYQPKGTEAFVGEDITLQCSFVYPKTKQNITEVTVVWKASKVKYCGAVKEEFYNSVTKIIFPQYRGRLILTGDPKAQNASINLMNVTMGDANTYCCRLTLKYSDGKPAAFQSPEGTHLTVRGEDELRIEQPAFISAFRGDTVTIFSRYATKNQDIVPDIISCHVWKSSQGGPGCDAVKARKTCTERTGKDILHFKISHVNISHQGWYCWEIQVLSRDGKRFTYKTNVGTELRIVEHTNYFDIWQPTETVFKKPTVIHCIYTVPLYSDIVWIGVYWMVGNPREDFVYHPDTDFIHPDYKGKIRLLTESNLLLEDFHGPDSTMFYCRVVLLRCGSHTINGTKTEVVMEEGSGTRLRIYNMPDPAPDESPSQAVTIAIYAGIKLIILLVLLLVALVCLKKK